MKPPPRLRDDPNAAPELRADLKRVGSAPIAYDAAAGLVGFQALVAGSLGSSAGAGAGGQAVAQGKAAAAATHAAATTKTAGLLGSAGAKLALAAVGTAAVVAASVATWPAAHHAVPSEARHTAMASPTAPSESPQPPVVDSLATKPAAMQPQDTGAPAAAPTHRVAQARVALAPGAAPAQTNADDALRREIAQLAQIKAAVDTDPARAYRLAQAGHREFSRGMLRQEREALAVLSLSQLGRRTEAARRARAFLARYPQSPLRESIERVLHPEIE